MAKSKIVITFNSNPSYGQVLSIRNNLFPIDILETFNTTRVTSYQCGISELGATMTAVGYATSIWLDYNTNELYIITNNGNNVVTIEATQSNVVFSEITNTTNGAVTTEIFNETETDPITIDSVSFSESAANQCDKVKINVITNVLAVEIDDGAVIYANSDNPFSYEWVRGAILNLQVRDALSNIAFQTIKLPQKLAVENTAIAIINSPSGATVTINVNESYGLTLQYSLDNNTFQELNSYSGQVPGNYTIYIKDQLGCTIQKNFTISNFEDVGTGVGVNIPYAKLPSKANSIRFKKDVVWGTCGNYKNDENTLSYEVDVPLPETEFQKFQSCDTNIPTQISSNYENIEVKVIKCDLSETIIPVVKMTNFIGLKDKRDAIRYNLENGRTGIYFTSGNKYNYDTGVVEDTFALNGAVPEWAYEDNYILINNAWYVIENVFYDDAKLAEVIVISMVYTGADETIIVGSVYNLFNYEDYEFYIDMSVFLNEKIQVKIIETDPRFETVSFTSEIIDVKEIQENTIEIVYFNDNNTDLNYGTGIIHKIRIPFISKSGKGEDESEVHDTDNDAILLSASLRELDEFIFEPLTTEMWRKLMIALSHKHLTINGVPYIKGSGFNSEGPLGKTNLHVLTALMKRTENVYDFDNEGALIGDGTEIEIPGLISSGDDGLVGY